MSDNEKNEFDTFMNSSTEAPYDLKSQISSLVHGDLKRLPMRTFAKTLSAHWVAGALTLAVCPQFGWNPFSSSPHLPHIFMQYGMWACGLFCGTIFMALGALISMAFLNGNERVYLSTREWSYALSLSFLSMGVLMVLGRASSGGDVFFTESFIIFWLIGAFLFDLAALRGLFHRYASV